MTGLVGFGGGVGGFYLASSLGAIKKATGSAAPGFMIFAGLAGAFLLMIVFEWGAQGDFFRGSRPKPEDFKALAALGINTVIDLTDNSMQQEKPAVEAAGMRYINIPIVDKAYPSVDQANAFLKAVNDPTTGKFYVHCAGGRHRTGLMGAVYRFNHDGWNFDQAYAEMKEYDFYTSNGHGKQLDFVRDYWQQFLSKNVNANANTAISK